MNAIERSGTHTYLPELIPSKYHFPSTRRSPVFICAAKLSRSIKYSLPIAHFPSAVSALWIGLLFHGGGQRISESVAVRNWAHGGRIIVYLFPPTNYIGLIVSLFVNRPLLSPGTCIPMAAALCLSYPYKREIG